MENQIIELIEEEVTRRVNLRTTALVETIAKLYDLPAEKLVKDVSGLETHFCRGVLKSKKRCLKHPKENGYCGFHQNQVPPVVAKPVTRVEAPWQL